MPVEFYDVRKKAKVQVPEGNIRKKTYRRTTAAGKEQVRYGLVADYNGSKLTKFVNEAEWRALNVPETND
jgi:hypothetical protein